MVPNLDNFSGKYISKGAENFVLEGANPSAEGEDADEGGEGGESQRVLDIVDQFRLNSVPPPSKKGYQTHLKSQSKYTAVTDRTAC